MSKKYPFLVSPILNNTADNNEGVLIKLTKKLYSRLSMPRISISRNLIFIIFNVFVRFS